MIENPTDVAALTGLTREGGAVGEVVPGGRGVRQSHTRDGVYRTDILLLQRCVPACNTHTHLTHLISYSLLTPPYTSSVY